MVGGDGGRQSRAEHWLSELDVREVNRDHIQSFLQHKLQHQQLQVAFDNDEWQLTSVR